MMKNASHPQPLPGMKIGILGGSFNPAHDGHLHVSRQALEMLGLDEIWWLVSPQNPLKPKSGMAPFARRMETARDIAARDGRIRVTDFEKTSATRYSIDTINALIAAYPQVSFVWIIGADNMRQMPRWKGWEKIFRTIAIAVFPRAPYSARAVNGRAARRFARARLDAKSAARLARTAPPAWVMLDAPLNAQSASRIREMARGADAGEKPGQKT